MIILAKKCLIGFYRKIMVKKLLPKSFKNEDKCRKIIVCYASGMKSLSAEVIDILRNNYDVYLVDISRFLEYINQNNSHDEFVLKNEIIDEFKRACKDFSLVTKVIYLLGDGQQTQAYDSIVNDVILLVYMIQCLSAVLSSENRTQLFLTTTSLYSSHPKKVSLWGGLSGLLRSLNKENAILQLYHVDFSESDVKQIARNLTGEIQDNISEPEVYYINRIRYIPKLMQVKHEFRMTTAIQRDKHYIIVGGLGGIGFILAKFLLKNYQAHLTIVGRSCGENAQVLQKMRQLHSISSTVKYFTADVCEQDDINKLQKYIHKNRDALQGVFYLAGDFNFISFAQLTKVAIYNELKAKIIGALRMVDLLKQENSEGLFVSFSSLTSTIGGSGYSMYAMANSFLEWMTDYLSKTTQLKAFCLAWSAWDKIGLSNKTIISKQALEKQGYGIVGRGQGLRSLEFALSNPNINNLLVGLNITNSTVGLVEGIDSQVISLKDKQNLTKKNSVTKPKKILSIEKKLESIIADSLFVDDVNIMEDFSSLGLTSLTTYRIIDRINKLWGMEIPIGVFFENATIEKMSEFINQKWGNSILI